MARDLRFVKTEEEKRKAVLSAPPSPTPALTRQNDHLHHGYRAPRNPGLILSR